MSVGWWLDKSKFKLWLEYPLVWAEVCFLRRGRGGNDLLVESWHWGEVVDAELLVEAVAGSSSLDSSVERSGGGSWGGSGGGNCGGGGRTCGGGGGNWGGGEGGCDVPE